MNKGESGAFGFLIAQLCYQEVKGLFYSKELQAPLNGQHWLCASYVRLSKEDEDAGNGGKDESNSITNQKALIRDYLADHPDLELAGEFVDDGYSGVNFDRPDFKRMMEEVKNRRINCIIVKDLSRFGRNYIEAGKYLEQVFPFLGVRFIAITDDMDTGRKQSDAEQFILPFKNLFNDSYCKDISTKVRSQLAIKRKNGQYVGSFACYGYLKDPADHNKLIIDPETSGVVQQIFYWKIQGLSADRIAERLNSLGVLCPMEYKRSMGMKVSTNFRTKGKAQWAPKSVLRILKNEIYVGVMTQGKMTTPSYKIRKLIEKPEEEWDRVEGTHEAIIHKDVFDVVQSLLLRDTRISPDEKQLYLFSGFLFCGDCGMNMIRSRRKYKNTVYAYYSCSGYKRKSGCNSHIISERQLYDAVLAAIKHQCSLVLDMERLLKYAQNLPDDPKSRHHFEAQLARLDEEIKRNQDMKVRLLENLNEGIISREDYQELSAIYDSRIRDSRQAKQNVEAERDGLKNLPLESEWLNAFKRYHTINELDRIMLAELVDFIEVHENKTLTIHFKFADQIERVQQYLSSIPALNIRDGGNRNGTKKPSSGTGCTKTEKQ